MSRELLDAVENPTRRYAASIGHLAPRPGRRWKRLPSHGARARHSEGGRRSLRLPPRSDEVGDHQRRRNHARLVRHQEHGSRASRRDQGSRGVTGAARSLDRTRAGARHSFGEDRARWILPRRRNRALRRAAIRRGVGGDHGTVLLPPQGRAHRDPRGGREPKRPHLHGPRHDGSCRPDTPG